MNSCGRVGETVCGVNFESGCVFHLMGAGKKGESREWGRRGEGFSIDGRKHGRGGAGKGKRKRRRHLPLGRRRKRKGGTGLPSRVAKREGLLKSPAPGGVDSLLPSRVSHPKRAFEKRGRKKVLLLVNLMME